MDFLDPVYMVRGPAFGSDFNSKLAFCLITVGLVVWDRYRSKRWDYAWVMLVGAVALTLLEISMQLRGTRSLPDRVLLGEHLPLVASALLQGISEGAFIAVFGLFFADRILCRRSRNRTLIALALVLFLMALLVVLQAAGSDTSGQVAGRRDMTAVGPFVLLILVVAFDVWFWWRRPQYRDRSLMMTAVMLGLVTVWTTASVATGGRWIEVPGPTSGSFQRASSAVSISALTFDIVFEVVMASVPFFAIPALLGLVGRSPTRRQASDEPSTATP
ncbi:MAG: hypothetical protein WCI74_01960 [Actinomycetes bacterium]